ncbi:MAG: hypothetical protein IJU76_15190 [Desulfovibrionaceae bacterium]|nr:hypothetical protein [Desulfovibrionaceae bacterium]
MDTQQIVDITARCTKACQDAQAWVANNEDRVRSCGKTKDSLLADLRQQARLFRKLGRAAHRKMCAGVFGPSQAGKSYLLSSLAQDENGAVLCDFNGKTHDFLREINPEGGKESTGLVTRFTMTQPANIPAGYPVHVRLLSETELVKIFANTYYCDAVHKEGVDKKGIQDALEPLKARVGAPCAHITIDVMEDLHEYVSSSFGDKARPVALDEVYWTTAIEIAPRLSRDDRVQLYSIIWNKVDEFTDMLSLLLQDLEKLDYSEEIFCSLNALLPREASIIDVETLGKKDFSDCKAQPSVDVRAASGKIANIERKNLTAIVAELTLVMVHKPANYFDHTDLLDFPGYKARLETSNLVDYLRSDKADSAVEQFFRRGKVAYLFQRYNAERELTSLLLCNSTTDNIPGLPAAIEDWIIATHGKTPEERVNVKNALLYILTKADTIFETGAGKNVDTMWDSTLKGKFLAHFGNTFSQATRWVEKWTPTQPFNNMFLLRNVNIPWKGMMRLSKTGDVYVEEGIQDTERHDTMRAAFLQSNLVKKHFRSPETCFDELMKLNDGGIEHIKRCLEPLCDPNLKQNQISNAVLRAQDRLYTLLSPLYHSGNQEEELKKKKALFLKIRNFSDNPLFRERFPELLNSFSLPIEQVAYLRDDAERRYEDYKQAYCSIAMEPEDTRSTTAQEIDESALEADFDPDNWFGSSTGSPSPSENNTGSEQSAAQGSDLSHEKDLLTFYVERIIEAWSAHSHAKAENPDISGYYLFPQSYFLAMLDEFDAALFRLDIRGKIEKKFRDIGRFAGDEELKTRRQASYAMGVLNSFISWLGKNPADTADSERVVDFNGREMQVFRNRPEVIGYPDLPKNYDAQEHAKQWFRDWLVSFYGMLVDNAASDASGSINIHQNALLGTILKSIKGDEA